MNRVIQEMLPDASPRGLIRLVLAAALTILIVVHLFRLEELVQAIGVIFNIQSGASIGVSALLVITELVALPVLLGMPLGSKAKVGGVVCGCLAACLWISIGLVAGIAHNGADTGLLGSLIRVPGEMAIMAACASLIAVLLTISVRR